MAYFIFLVIAYLGGMLTTYGFKKFQENAKAKAAQLKDDLSEAAKNLTK